MVLKDVQTTDIEDFHILLSVDIRLNALPELEVLDFILITIMIGIESLFDIELKFLKLFNRICSSLTTRSNSWKTAFVMIADKLFNMIYLEQLADDQTPEQLCFYWN